MHCGDEQAQRTAGGQVEQRQHQHQHIFCVNGEPAFLNLLRELLQRRQYNVTTSNFVPETYDVIEALQPELIVVDLVADEQSGWDLLEQLARDATTSGIPLLITSTDPPVIGSRAKCPRSRRPRRHATGKVFLDRLGP